MNVQSVNSTEERVVKTLCPMCATRCGINVHLRGNTIVKVEPMPEHKLRSGLCLKNTGLVDYQQSKDRLLYPLKRVDGNFVRVSWEEAIEVAAERLGEVRARFGARSICTTLRSPPMALFTRTLGSPNEMTNTDLCQGAAEIADPLTFGDVITIYRSAEDFRNSKCIFLVGTDMATATSGHWLDILHAQTDGAKVIVVDPRRCESAKYADVWLQIRPGSDGALALAIINIIISEDLYDKGFVENYCVGFDTLREHVKPFTAKWAAEITSLPEEKIVEVAKLIGNLKPVAYRGNNGMTQIAQNQENEVTGYGDAFGKINTSGENGNVVMHFPPGADDRRKSALCSDAC